MTACPVKALDATTWPDFARLVDKHSGVWGGCWCMSFHPRITCFFVDRGYRRRGVGMTKVVRAGSQITKEGS